MLKADNRLIIPSCYFRDNQGIGRGEPSHGQFICHRSEEADHEALDSGDSTHQVQIAAQRKGREHAERVAAVDTGHLFLARCLAIAADELLPFPFARLT